MKTTDFEPSAILLTGDADRDAEQPLEPWTPEEFDHFTDLGLLRSAFDG